MAGTEKMAYNTQNTSALSSAREDWEMLAALSLGFMLAIWVIVIWGAIHFNHNVQ